jgi:hypothetical protein
MDSIFEAAHGILESSTEARAHMDIDILWGRLEELGFDGDWYDDFLVALKSMKYLMVFPDGEMFLVKSPWKCRECWRIVHGSWEEHIDDCRRGQRKVAEIKKHMAAWAKKKADATRKAE